MAAAKVAAASLGDGGPALDAVVESVSAAELNRPAKRPQNSRLRCLRMEKLGFRPLPDWETALEQFVREETAAKN